MKMSFFNETDYRIYGVIAKFAFDKLEAELGSCTYFKSSIIRILGSSGDVIFLDNFKTGKDLRKFQIKVLSIREKLGELEITWKLLLEPTLVELAGGKNIIYSDSTVDLKTFPLDIKDARIAVTGSLSEYRPTVEYRIKDAGGKVESSVTGKTDILLAGYYCGSNKLAKAREKKIPIFREDKFKKYIKESPVSRTLKDIVR